MNLFSRRNVLASSAALAAGALADQLNAADVPAQNTAYTPVHTPNGVTAPFKIIDGVKVFHLVASEFDHEFAPGLVAKCWGYNGRTPGPTLELVEGDRVRIYVTNNLIAPTTVHWHGIILANGMDGVSGLSQAPIPPGQTFKYEFTLRQFGTFMYHSHFDEMNQIAFGMMGMLIIHPKDPAARPKVDRDFVIMLSEWDIPVGMSRPNPNQMTDFNIFTMNSRAFPGTAPLVCKKGDRVRVRFGNLSPMDHHPIHIHGHNWRVTGTDGGMIPPTAQIPETTVLVPVGSTRDVEFTADNPGDWAMHCHMSHHPMNQMGHDIPNLIGIDVAGLDDRIKPLVPGYMTMGETGMGEHGKHMQHMPLPRNSIPMKGADGPFSYIDMGGMFTIIKIREENVGYDDPGWYKNPPGTVSVQATADELRRDGITISAKPGATQPTLFTCRHHPEVVMDHVGICPKCNMKLTPKK